MNSPFDYTSEDVGYTYDARGQLLTSTYAQPTNGPSQTDESYAYDANGNRQLVTNSASTAQTVINGPNNRVLSDGAFTYTYDAEGNRISRTNIATGGTTTYTWDHRNRLVRVEETNSVGTITQSTEHTYDAFNQWITRDVDPDGETGTAAIERTIFAHDRGQIVLQFDGEVTNPASENLTAADLSHRYLWGPAVDQLLADEQVDGNTTEGETIWALGDQLGSVRDLVRLNETTAATELANHITYDSYGRKTAETDAAIEELFGYTGRAFDESTGLQNNLNRWLDAASGKWLSEDPISFNGGDANLARYVGNHPTGATDPTGLVEPSLNLYRDLFYDYPEWRAGNLKRREQETIQKLDQEGMIEAILMGLHGEKKKKRLQKQLNCVDGFDYEIKQNQGTGNLLIDIATGVENAEDHAMLLSTGLSRDEIALYMLKKSIRLAGRDPSIRSDEWYLAQPGMETFRSLAGAPFNPGTYIAGGQVARGGFRFVRRVKILNRLRPPKLSLLRSNRLLIENGKHIVNIEKKCLTTSTMKVSTLKGRQLKAEFSGSQIKRLKRNMQVHGFDPNHPIQIVNVDGKRIIYDGHHRARAAGSAGITEVPVEIIEVSREEALKMFEEAAAAAHDLGLPF